MRTQGSKQKQKLVEKALHRKAMNNCNTFSIPYFCWQKKNSFNSANCLCFSHKVDNLQILKENLTPLFLGVLTLTYNLLTFCNDKWG